MASATEPGRLRPSLLDRLTDDDPDSKTEVAPGRRGMSMRALRQSLERDLEWLLNTGGLAGEIDYERYPLIAESVLNYGTPDLAGTTVSGLDAGAVERALRQAIVNFEPRLMKNSLTVGINVDGSQMGRNAIRFDIEGQMWAQPVPEPIYLRTEIDLESGVVSVSDQSSGRQG